MQRSYVLDTNILLSDAESIFKFEEHNVVISIEVLQEIDTFKKDQSELGRNARAFSRYMDKLRLKGKLIDGVEVNEQGGKIYVVLFDQSVGNCLPFQDMTITDNRILATAKYVETYMKLQSSEVIMVTLDTNLRIKSDVLGIKAEDYKNNKVVKDDTFTGINHLDVDHVLIDKVYEQKILELADLLSAEDEPAPNECFVIHSRSNDKQRALLRYDGVMKQFNLLPQDLKTVDIIPKNTEQCFAMDILKDNSINLVTIKGKAGSGKTLISLAAGLDAVLNKQTHTKLLLLKPIIAMANSNELGFLPGNLAEKLSPWMASYTDNLDLIMKGYVKGDDKPKKKSTKKEVDTYNEKQQGKTNPLQELIELGLVEMGSLEHMRGRSLPNQYILIDECQNTNLNLVRSLITRSGEGTKIVLLGDVSQIDSPYIDQQSNGLSIVTEKFRNESISAHITMKKSERSKLAELAAELL